MASVLTAFEKL